MFPVFDVYVQDEQGVYKSPPDFPALDLSPKTVSAEFRMPAGGSGRYWIAVDPQDVIPEIYEGNNRVPLPPRE